MTRMLRRISQGIFLGLFLCLILITAYPLKPGVPVDVFVQLSPLVAGAVMLASRALIPELLLAIPVIVVTILLGRVFCGWICPLGTTLDAADKVFFRAKRTTRKTPPRALKYYILAGLFVTGLFTMQAVYLLDPLSLFTRTVVLVFFAPVQLLIRFLAEFSYGLSFNEFAPLAKIGMWTSDRLAATQFVALPQAYFRQAFVVLAIFVAIVGLNSVSRRYWCSNLCPLGALLGLLARVPVLKRVVNEKCIDCGKCISDCKTAAIPSDPRLTRTSECIECFNCVQVCPTDAVSFRLRAKPDLRPETSLNLSRRRLLQGAGVGLGFSAIAALDPGRKRAIGGASSVKLSSNSLIRPPGSIRENDFVARCIRCGQCMKVCPTNGLQPAFHEAGIEGFWTPILVPKIGYCAQECNACGEVCPTEAIEPFEIEDKPEMFIGRAVIERDHCIAWNSDKACLVCDEYCSYKAIEWQTVDGVRRPFVNDEVCVGCGICEWACPIQPVAAIRVWSFGDRREQ